MLGLRIQRPASNSNIKNSAPPARKNNNQDNSNNYAEENVWEVNLDDYKLPIGNTREYGEGNLEWAGKPLNLLSPIELPENASPRNQNSRMNNLNVPSPIPKPSNASTLSMNSLFNEPPSKRVKLSRKNRRANRKSRKNRKSISSRRNNRK
jgi:hypothetical protein